MKIRNTLILKADGFMDGQGITIFFLCYIFCVGLKILHIIILKTTKFVRHKKSINGSPGFSSHMSIAFRDVLFILFQLSYFSDSKTFYCLWNQMHLIIHGSLQLLLTQEAGVTQLALTVNRVTEMSSQVRHMVATSYIEFNYSSKLLQKIKLLFNTQWKSYCPETKHVI